MPQKKPTIKQRKNRAKPVYKGDKNPIKGAPTLNYATSIKPSISIPMLPSIKPKSPKILRAITSPALQIMFHGPRFTSKSYTNWKEFAAYHEMIPNLQSFIVRNEAKTIAKTVLKTFLRMLKYPSKKHPKNPFEIVGGINFPQRILWDNGGITEFGGLDDPDKILGGDYHMGWYNEVQREKREESFSNLLGCFVGERAGPLPSWVPWRYRMYMDCNPTSPSHFIYRRQVESEALRKAGKEAPLEWYNVLHRDNPMLSNWDDNGNFLGLNERGEHNESDLLNIYPPGYMRDRMVYGIPRGAEGMVYPMWSPKRHVFPMPREFFPPTTVWRWSIDIGGRDPHAIGIFGQIGEKHYLFKEICKSMVMIEDVIKMAEALCKKYKIPKPNAVFIDHNVKDFVLQLQAKGYPVILCEKKSILEGVETFKEALADMRFFVNEFSLEERDPLMGGEPQGLKEEIPSYVHKPPEKRSGNTKDDEPDQTNKNKHFCDLSRYYISSLYLSSIEYDINYSDSYIKDSFEEEDYADINFYGQHLQEEDIGVGDDLQGDYFESFNV